jgi:hypothetical protein
MWTGKQIEYGKYRMPQYYSVEDRISIIEKHLKEGMSFHEIGMMFAGVMAITIEYHWKRYKLKIAPKKKICFEKQKDVYKEYITELSKAGLI